MEREISFLGIIINYLIYNGFDLTGVIIASAEATIKQAAL